MTTINDRIEPPIILCFGLLVSFVGSTLFFMYDKTYFANWCGGTIFLFSLPLVIIGLIDSNSKKITTLAIGMGFTGFLFIALVILAVVDPSLREFIGIGKILIGFLMMGGAWFILFPPDMTDKRWNGLKGNTKMSVIPPPVGLSVNDSDDSDDMIDQYLHNIINSDTTLSALSQTDPKLANKIQLTFDYYNPEAGVFGSWARRMRGEGRTKLLEVLNKEQRLLIEQAALFEDEVRKGRRSEAEHHMYLARNAMEFIEIRTKAKLNKKAFDKEMLPEDWSTVRKEQEFLDIRIKEEEARSNLEEIREEERLKRKLKEQDEEVKRKLESARAYKMNEDTITDDLRNKMHKALIDIDEIEARTDISDKTKVALKISKENEVENLRRRIDARERKAASDEESFL